MSTEIHSNHDVTSQFPPRLPSADVGERLYRTGLAWRRAVFRALEPIPLTVGQYQLLVGLAALTKKRPHASFSNREIAEEAGVDEQTTYRVMKSLWARDMISREGDSCQWLNLITNEGLETLATAKPIVESASERFLDETFPDLCPLLEQLAPLVPTTKWTPRRRRRTRIF